MEKRLVLKEKDYQFDAIKRKIQFKHSFTDPLINPSKKQLNQFSKNKLKNNTLPKAQKLPLPKQQQNTKPQSWKQILNLFVDTYGLSRDKLQQQIPNQFGSQGLKTQRLVSKSEVSDKQKTISIQTFLRIVEGMKSELQSKWESGDKVSSLQIVVQACKLLHDISNTKFHALKFVKVIQIIDYFGTQVFKRIKSLSFPNSTTKDTFDLNQLQSSNIPQSAQQICRNWLHKISSIRQILPRSIIETALLRLHFFLNNGQRAKRVLTRLIKSNRSIGQYINCIFYCTYLIRMGVEIFPLNKDFILDILDDVFFYIKQGRTKFCRPDISYDQFFIVLEPFFISAFRSLAQNLPQDKFKRFCSMLPQNAHPVILKNFIQGFRPSLLVFYCVDIVKIVQKLYKDSKNQIYKLLFSKLRSVKFSQGGQFIVLSWTDISEITEAKEMLELLSPFSNIVFNNLDKYETTRFYNLIFQTFNKIFNNFREISVECYGAFQLFLTDVLASTQKMNDILMLEPFLHLIGYFPLKIKSDLSKKIINTLLNKAEYKIQDPILASFFLTLLRNCNNVEQQGMKFLNKVDFGNYLQQALNFYCQYRTVFAYSQKIIVSLIHKAAHLTFTARRLSRDKMTNKLLYFLQSALAYCFITVPMLANTHNQLRMYLFLTETALSNNLIEQTTELIKTCIICLSEQKTEGKAEDDIRLFEVFCRIISLLIVVPDDPAQDYLFLYSGLVEAFKIAKFTTNYEHILRLQFHTHCLTYLSCQAQARLPFHVDGVLSNDALFKNPAFKLALVQMIYEGAEAIEALIPQVAEYSAVGLDAYVLHHLTQCLVSLLTNFEPTPRMHNIVHACVKTISRSKDKLTNDPSFAKYKVALKAVNDKLLQNGYQISIKI